MVMQLPENDVVSVTVEQMRAELDVCMGGRAAEEFVFGVDQVRCSAVLSVHGFEFPVGYQVTSGASSDLQRATDVARRMVSCLLLDMLCIWLEALSRLVGCRSRNMDSVKRLDQLCTRTVTHCPVLHGY